MRALLALGGNAMTSPDGRARPEDQIAAAETPSTERRPNLSASNPELTIAINPTVAPTISTIRNFGAVSVVNNTTHDSGNTVTMWNNPAGTCSDTVTPLRPPNSRSISWK